MRKKNVFSAMLMAVAMSGTYISCSNDMEDVDLNIENEHDAPQEDDDTSQGDDDTSQGETEEEESTQTVDYTVPTGYKKPENSNSDGRHRTPPLHTTLHP